MSDFLDYLRRNGLVKNRSSLPYLSGSPRVYTNCQYFMMNEVGKTQYFDWIEPDEADELCINCSWYTQTQVNGIRFNCTNPFLRDVIAVYDQQSIF